MKSPTHVGARWWKVDFHCHTPASIDYGKGPDQAKLKQTPPEEWLLTYMRAGIDAVMITDHNSGEWVDEIKAALVSESVVSHPDYRPLVLFPGAEITANAGIHVLAIFDPSESSQRITYLLGACNCRGKQGDPAGTCEDSVEAVVQNIFQAGGIPILAHVEDANGAFKELPGQTLLHLAEHTQLYAYEQVDPKNPLPPIIEKKARTWAQVVGSDAHHLTGPVGTKYPGSHFTWVKMDTPNLEGLRLALLDGNGLSVKRFDETTVDPNQMPDLWIEELSISNASVMGRGAPLKIDFSPRLNGIVGGRGSGKSTLIELIRVASGREDELPPSLQTSFAAYYGEQRMREGKGAYTSSTHIALTLNSHGTRFRLSVTAPSLEVRSEREEKPGEWIASLGSVHDRFPLRIFSQKQVFEMATNRAGLLRQIDQHESVHYDEWKAKWDLLYNEYLELGRRLRELEKRVNERHKTVGALEDVNRKLVVFESMGHESVLKEHNHRQTQFNIFTEALKDLSGITDVVEKILPSIALSDFDLIVFDSNSAIDNDAKQLLVTANQEVDKFKSDVEARLKVLKTYIDSFKGAVRESEFYASVKSAESKYQDLTQQLAQQGVANLNQYGTLVQQRQIHRKTLAELDALPPTIQQIQARRETLLKEIESWRQEITQRRQTFLDSIVGNNPLIRMTISHCGRDPVATEAQWREVLGKVTNMKEPWLSEDGSEGMIAEMYVNLPKDTSQAEVHMRRKLAELKREVEELVVNRNHKDRKQWAVNYFRTLSAETVDRVRLWWPEDSLEIDFKVSEKGNDYKPIRDGSPGQRTAAVLAFLLSYGTEPMILDQPEDDLDNHLIYDLIVTQLRENKVRRQVIVVTHNANIVVNGDAEYVIPMEYRSGQCRVSKSTGAGSLQSKAIRDEVCRVMEGGRIAFEKRYRRMHVESDNV